MKKSRLVFHGFAPYEGGRLARMATAGELEIPVNVYADPGTDLMMPLGTACEFALYGITSESSIQIFHRMTDYLRSDIPVGCPGMMPAGAVPTEEQEGEGTFAQTPVVLFSGIVQSVEVLGPQPGRPPFLAEIRTLGMTVNLYYDCDRAVRPGDLFFCDAWLFGVIRRE